MASPSAAPSPSAAGSLLVQTLLFGDRASVVHWSPGGSYVAAVIPNLGANEHGGVRVYTGDGSRLVATFAGIYVTWLDDETLAVQQDFGNGAQVVIRSMAPYPDVALPATIQGVFGDQLAHAVVSAANPVDGSAPRQWLLGHWTTTQRGEPGYWSELGPLSVQGGAIAWSPDGRFLALAVQVAPTGMAGLVSWQTGPGQTSTGTVAPAAASDSDNRLVLLRVPPGSPVATPEGLVWSNIGGWFFSPDGRLLAGVAKMPGSNLLETTILDISAGAVARTIPGTVPIGWTPFGSLELQQGDAEAVELWDPTTDAFTATGLTGFPEFGPVRGEVAYVGENDVHVEMAGRSEVIPILSDTPVGQIAWAPDGSAVVISDLDYRLLRISAP